MKLQVKLQMKLQVKLQVKLLQRQGGMDEPGSAGSSTGAAPQTVHQVSEAGQSWRGLEWVGKSWSWWVVRRDGTVGCRGRGGGGSQESTSCSRGQQQQQSRRGGGGWQQCVDKQAVVGDGQGSK
jgi:hypothetical protein